MFQCIFSVTLQQIILRLIRFWWRVCHALKYSWEHDIWCHACLRLMLRNISLHWIVDICNFGELCNKVGFFCIASILPILYRGRVDDLSFFGCLSLFCFLLIEFNCTFYISYKILTNYVHYYCILIMTGLAVGTSFFFRARITSFHTHASLTFFVCFFILFHSCCSHARVFEKTHAHASSSFPMARLNGTCFFPTVQLQVHNV